MDQLSMKTVIDRAIKNEEDAHLFYMSLYHTVADPVAKEALEFLAAEELKHKDFLEKFLMGIKSSLGKTVPSTVDYKIAQYVSMPDIKKDMTTSEVYLVAAHREWNSYLFYTGLAGIQPEGELKSMLLQIAAEELKHKEKVEYLYANTEFTQTSGG